MRKIKNEKVWIENYTFGDIDNDNIIRKMAADLGISELLAVLLYNRGYKTAEKAQSFLHFKEANFHDPFLMKDMDKAVDRIFLAIKNKEKICIYGDYDVDGVTSVSMLYLYLLEYGADVVIKIPKRDGEGYGVSCAAIDVLAAEGVSLIITVDTGITANDEVDYAASLGVDFVVTDHHECRSELPCAKAVVNPHRPDCQYPFKELAGVGVVFKLVSACEIYRRKDTDVTVLASMKRICATYSDLAALGTIADVMPVVDENRLIISMGLNSMENNCRPGLLALIEASSKKNADPSKKKKITSGFIGFGIAPRINAAGRMSDAIIAVNLLLAENPDDASRFAEELCAINRQRQLEENRIANEAYEMIEQNFDWNKDRVIVLENNEWQQGIIGIVSSKITERYGLPSILVSFSGAVICEENPLDDGKGSGRSIKGMNLVEALSYCDDLLVKYGGHELAAGLTVKRGNLEEFKIKINEYAREQLSPDDLKIKLEADCEITAQDITLALANELQLLEPYGTGNTTPMFVMKNARVKKITATKGGEHTRLLVEQSGVGVVGMYFGVGEADLGFESGDLVDILFNIDINEYKNIKSVQMIVRDCRLAEEFTKQVDTERKRYHEIKQGGEFYLVENILPNRDDFARVYSALRKEFRLGVSVLDYKGILKLVNNSDAEPINYVKLKYILHILNELKICDVIELADDIYSFQVIFNANKTSIEKSGILKKLRTQCVDRIHQES